MIKLDDILNERLSKEKAIQDFWLKRSRQWVSTLVDFVLTALPLVAPVPNLINLAIALESVMGFYAAILAAVAFELLLFGSAEIILYLQDKQLRNGGYELPLKIAVVCGVLLIAILLVLIAWYEVPSYGLAVLTLPFVSVISIAFLSLKKYVDIRDTIGRDNAQYEDSLLIAQNQNEQLEQLVSELREQLEQLAAQNEQLLSEQREQHRLATVASEQLIAELREQLSNEQRATEQKVAQIEQLLSEQQSLNEQLIRAKRATEQVAHTEQPVATEQSSTPAHVASEQLLTEQLVAQRATEQVGSNTIEQPSEQLLPAHVSNRATAQRASEQVSNLSVEDVEQIINVIMSNDVSSGNKFAQLQNVWAESTARRKFGLAVKSSLISKNGDGNYHVK